VVIELLSLSMWCIVGVVGCDVIVCEWVGVYFVSVRSFSVLISVSIGRWVVGCWFIMVCIFLVEYDVVVLC